jgi:hypothetical protein
MITYSCCKCYSCHLIMLFSRSWLSFHFHSFYFFLLLCWGTLWNLQRFLQCIILEFTAPHFWNSFKKLQFSIYIYVYTIFAPYSPSYTFFEEIPQTWPILPPVFINKWNIYLFKITIHSPHLAFLFWDTLYCCFNFIACYRSIKTFIS